RDRQKNKRPGGRSNEGIQRIRLGQGGEDYGQQTVHAQTNDKNSKASSKPFDLLALKRRGSRTIAIDLHPNGDGNNPKSSSAKQGIALGWIEWRQHETN